MSLAIILIDPHTYAFAYEISNFSHRFLIGFSKKVIESSLVHKVCKLLFWRLCKSNSLDSCVISRIWVISHIRVMSRNSVEVVFYVTVIHPAVMHWKALSVLFSRLLCVLHFGFAGALEIALNATIYCWYFDMQDILCMSFSPCNFSYNLSMLANAFIERGSDHLHFFGIKSKD